MLIRFDWMAGISLPQAHVELNAMFYQSGKRRGRWKEKSKGKHICEKAASRRVPGRLPEDFPEGE